MSDNAGNAGNRGDVPCCTCKQAFPIDAVTVVARAKDKKPPVHRCKRCAALRARIERLKDKHGSLISDWRDMSVEEKDAFISANHELAGPDLIASLQETVPLRQKMTSKVRFAGEGVFKAESDLDKEYADTPQFLANIKKNARKFWDPVKEEYLFEDVIYKSEFADEEIKEEERRQRVSFDQRPSQNPGTSAPQVDAVRNLAANPAPKRDKIPKKSAGALKKKVQKFLGIIAPVKMRMALAGARAGTSSAPAGTRPRTGSRVGPPGSRSAWRTA